MGVTTINAAQLAELQSLQEKMKAGEASAGDVWRKLASYGDSYAQAALPVIQEPGTMPWSVVRSIWHTTEADFGKFDKVAVQHAENYINTIARREDHSRPGEYRLPTTRNIEDSYVDALGQYGISRYTAIDVVVEKLIHENPNVSPPHWYNTPGVLLIERDRIEASDPSHFREMDTKKAFGVWFQTGLDAAQTVKQTTPVMMERELVNQHLRSYFGKSFSIQNNAGVSYYYNADTSNWAYFDKGGHGKASIDNNVVEIGPGNWRHDPASGQYQIKMNDGNWKIAAIDADANTQHPESATRYAQSSPEAPGHPAFAAPPARGPGSGVDSQQQPPIDPHGDGHRRNADESAPGVNPAVATAPPAKDPRHPNHPDHALHQQISAKTEALCESKGIPLASDELERVAASMTAEAKRQKISSADHVMFSERPGTQEIGENLIIIQGALDNPASRFSVVAAREAVQTPIAESFDKLEQVNQAQAVQQQQLAQEQQQEQGRSAHRMVG